MGLDLHMARNITREFKVLSDFFFYFAFGSNLLEERIHVQIKGAEYQGIGVLKDYHLVFYDHGKRWQGAVASIEAKPEDHVVGCVWRVPNSFAEELDKQESGYHRLTIPVRLFDTNETVECRTYQYSNPDRQAQPPSPHYKQVIVSGAKQHDFPSDYVKKLEEVPTNGYKGKVDLDLAVLKELNGQIA